MACHTLDNNLQIAVRAEEATRGEDSYAELLSSSECEAYACRDIHNLSWLADCSIASSIYNLSVLREEDFGKCFFRSQLPIHNYMGRRSKASRSKKSASEPNNNIDQAGKADNLTQKPDDDPINVKVEGAKASVSRSRLPVKSASNEQLSKSSDKRIKDLKFLVPASYRPPPNSGLSRIPLLVGASPSSATLISKTGLTASSSCPTTPDDYINNSNKAVRRLRLSECQLPAPSEDETDVADAAKVPVYLLEEMSNETLPSVTGSTQSTPHIMVADDSDSRADIIPLKYVSTQGYFSAYEKDVNASSESLKKLAEMVEGNENCRAERQLA